MANLLRETVTNVHHWTDTLFSFKTTRDPGFRFKSGYFTMIGLEQEGRPLLRAYSMASAHYARRPVPWWKITCCRAGIFT